MIAVNISIAVVGQKITTLGLCDLLQIPWRINIAGLYMQLGGGPYICGHTDCTLLKTGK